MFTILLSLKLSISLCIPHPITHGTFPMQCINVKRSCSYLHLSYLGIVVRFVQMLLLTITSLSLHVPLFECPKKLKIFTGSTIHTHLTLRHHRNIFSYLVYNQFCRVGKTIPLYTFIVKHDQMNSFSS